MTKAKAKPGTPQAHDYGTMPFGAHDTAASPSEEDTTMKAHELAVTRLQRDSIGATLPEAMLLADAIGVDQISAMSDEDLAYLVAQHQAEADAGETSGGGEPVLFSTHDMTVAEALEAVGTDKDKAQAAVDSETDRKPNARKTLLEPLAAIIAAPDEPADGESGDTGESGADPDAV